MAKMKIADGRRWLTTTEAAGAAGVSRRTIVREIEAGRLRAYYLTRPDGTPSTHRRVNVDDLDAFMRRNAVQTWPATAVVIATMLVGMAWPMIEGLPW